ncbi:MAG TPA: DRTGG domain-containing protein [Atribacterota bacterium]|nr:DRTGG domain-containing protein [Atribacterota bacterium]
MKLSEIIKKCSLEKVVFCSDEEIKTGYSGDLMSDVIANANNNSIWITVQAHKNSIAVALIKDIPAIIFTNKVSIGPEVIRKAKEESISIFHTPKNSFTISGEIHSLLEGKTEQG